MKNIFKKNHIIITALAIMIVIAGYLAFTNKDKPDEGAVTTANPATDDYEEFTGLDGLEEVNDNMANADTDVNGADMADTDVEGTDTAGATDAETSGEAASAETDDKNDEMAGNDISDEDILANSSTVSDNGELNTEDGVPGEAVLASTTLDASYFTSKRLDREQIRAKNREIFLEIIQSTDLSKDEKKAAVNGMIELTDIQDKEGAAEMLLEAKGFDGAIVFINDGTVDVVVNSATLTEQQLAIIEEIVKEKTDIPVEHININPVVVAD